MIIDTLEHLKDYVSLNPLFKDVVDFLEKNNLNELSEGKHLINGNDLFVNIQMAKGKTKDEALLETHKLMIDIQVPLSGEETFGYTPLGDLPEAEYNETKDITKYEGLAHTYVTCRPGLFAVFFPQDGHAPCISGEAQIKKAIFKVKA